MTSWESVLSGARSWSVDRADVLRWLAGLPPESIDLFVFSPPYEQARLYLENGKNLGVARKTEAWVEWMVAVFQGCLRACKGLVVCVCEGQTRNYRYSCAPALLMADLHRSGVNLRKPAAFHRVGIPGSGGPDWLRNDWEWIICASQPGKLPWSNNTACGHPPKWAPGGEMSNRLSDGTRVNQWGGHARSCQQRWRDGSRQAPGRPSHRLVKAARKVGPHPKTGSDSDQVYSYAPPVLANPGNVLRFQVGGGQMGHHLAHENEAPFPLGLAEFFVRSFCPPGGIVCDPFSGSGTTLHAAILHGRRFVGCDLRASQVALSKRRAKSVMAVRQVGS